MSHIPKEGLKIVCISGHIEGKPIWRTVGSMRISSNNKVLINLDRTFNPAGVSNSDDGPTVMLNALPFSPEELQKKEQYKAGNNKQQRTTTPYRFDDMDDDVPF